MKETVGLPNLIAEVIKMETSNLCKVIGSAEKSHENKAPRSNNYPYFRSSAMAIFSQKLEE